MLFFSMSQESQQNNESQEVNKVKYWGFMTWVWWKKHLTNSWDGWALMPELTDWFQMLCTKIIYNNYIINKYVSSKYKIHKAAQHGVVHFQTQVQRQFHTFLLLEIIELLHVSIYTKYQKSTLSWTLFSPTSKKLLKIKGEWMERPLYYTV